VEESSTDTHQIEGVSAGSTEDAGAGVDANSEDEDAHDYKNTGRNRSDLPDYCDFDAGDGDQGVYDILEPHPDADSGDAAAAAAAAGGEEAYLVVSSSKAGGAAEADHQTQIKPHQWKIHNYMSPAWCCYCKKLLKGLIKQGQKCRVCGKNCHLPCTYELGNTCEIRPAGLVPAIKMVKSEVFFEGCVSTSCASHEHVHPTHRMC
jgi:hypothetical protein